MKVTRDLQKELVAEKLHLTEKTAKDKLQKETDRLGLSFSRP